MMKAVWRRRPSPALIVSLMALVLAMGGFAVAAIPDGSGVFHACYKKKKGTLRLVSSTSKCKKKSEKGVSWNQKGTAGANGAAGAKGDSGPAGPFPDPLQSGKTLRGTYAIQSNVNGAQYRQGVSFGFSLSAAPTPHFIKVGDPVPSGCSGSVSAPDASPGHLCIFEGVQAGNTANRGEVNPVNDDAPDSTAPKFGFGVYSSCSTSPCNSEGTWAVTAP